MHLHYYVHYYLKACYLSSTHLTFTVCPIEIQLKKKVSLAAEAQYLTQRQSQDQLKGPWPPSQGPLGALLEEMEERMTWASPSDLDK